MYQVLIVDDEEIIRNGINRAIDWPQYDCQVCAIAKNGLEAMDIIRRMQPEIVITDLKMPGMNGLELIKETRREWPDIQFIILSGYGEFDFAKQAMKYGVKYYILKPCDDQELIVYLQSSIREIREKENRQKYLDRIRADIQKMIPQVKEQFLREMILGAGYTAEDMRYYRNLFGIRQESFKLIVLRPENGCDLTDKFALKNITFDVIRRENICLSTIVANEVILLIRPIRLGELTASLEEVKNNFLRYFKRDVLVGISNENRFACIRQMYQEVQECLKCEFYLDGKIVTKHDSAIVFSSRQAPFSFETYDAIADSVKTGNLENLTAQLDQFFETLQTEKIEIELVKTHCMELFLHIIRLGDPNEIGDYYRYLWKIGKADTLARIGGLIRPVAVRITRQSYETQTRKHSMIIRTMIECIEKNRDNPKLSLNWLAREVLFMNENYLGKLFLKETGEKFSQYVVKIRMEKAKEMLRDDRNYRMYEITRQIGFEENTQYFSQVFKKYTGLTPSEYKNAPRKTAEAER